MSSGSNFSARAKPLEFQFPVEQIHGKFAAVILLVYQL